MIRKLAQVGSAGMVFWGAKTATEHARRDEHAESIYGQTMSIFWLVVFALVTLYRGNVR